MAVHKPISCNAVIGGISRHRGNSAVRGEPSADETENYTYAIAL